MNLISSHVQRLTRTAKHVDSVNMVRLTELLIIFWLKVGFSETHFVWSAGESTTYLSIDLISPLEHPQVLFLPLTK